MNVYDPLRDYLNAAPVYVATRGAPVPQRRDLPATIRHAIRDARKMKIAYEGCTTSILRVRRSISR